MSKVVKVIFRSYLQGSQGYTNTGTPSPNKQLVIAQVVTTNVQSGLEGLTPQDLGLSTIDFIKVNVQSETGGVPAKSATTSVHADYDQVNQRLVICDVAAAGDRAAITNNEDPVVEVFAVGDSLLAPELT